MTSTWKIINLKRNPDTGLVFEVIYHIHYVLENQEDIYIKAMEIDGDPNDSNFIPFDNLTEEIILDWVQTKLGDEKILDMEIEVQTRLQEMIDKEKNPSFLQGIPWQNEEI